MHIYYVEWRSTGLRKVILLLGICYAPFLSDEASVAMVTISGEGDRTLTLFF